MAQEIKLPWLPGKTVYFLVRDSVGQVYNGSSFVPYVTADLATYAVASSEQGVASAFYTASFPAVPSGLYDVVGYERVGGSPSENDIYAGGGEMQWDGTAPATLASYAVALLKQTWVGIVGEADRSLLNALRKLRNRWSTTTTPGKLTVYKEDGTTPAFTEDITTDASADPITQLSPN